MLPLLLVGVAAYIDKRTSRIPNWLILFGLIAGLLLRAPQQLAGGLICFFLPSLVSTRRFGGGDRKLVALLGVYSGVLGAVEIFLYALFGVKLAGRRIKQPFAPYLFLGLVVYNFWRL